MIKECFKRYEYFNVRINNISSPMCLYHIESNFEKSHLFFVFYV